MKIVLIVLVVLGAVVVAGALFAGPELGSSLARFKPETPSTTVRAEKAVRRPLIETVSAPGEIEPHTRVQIAAEVSARILELPFTEGDAVRRGDIICKLDDRDVRAALLSAKARRDGQRFQLHSERARLEGLNSTLAFARKELERMQSLYDSGDVSGREFESADERVQDLEASLEATKYSISVVESSLAAAEADIERAEDALYKTTIESPMDGEITRQDVEVGEVVTGSTTNPGTVIMTIADRSRMVMKAQIAESDVARLEVGQRAKIYINAYPDKTFSGTVTSIALQRSGNPDGTGYFESEVEIDLRGERIRSGHAANVDIEVRTHDGIVVPYQAIVVREVEKLPEPLREHDLIDPAKSKTTVVYRVVDDKAVCTPVRAGASDLTHRLVLEGLEEGALVVTGPYKVLESIKDEERVTVESKEGEGEVKDAVANEGDDAAGEAETSGEAETDVEPDDGGRG